MKKFLLFLPLALIACSYGSCDNDPGNGNTHKEGKGGRIYGGTLRFNETDKFQTLYPTLITDAISSHVASQIYEGLVKFDPKTLRVVPCLAEKWEMDTAGKVYTFHLRKDVRFHDDACFADGKGRAVTADDVKYSFEQVCKNDGKNASFSTTFKDHVVGANALYNGTGALEGVRAIDPQTIEIRLQEPSISFLYILANPATSVIPKEAVEKYGDKMHVGTGPFMLANIAGDTSNLVLVRNNNYYGVDSLGNSLPFLDTIKISYIDNKRAELELFQAGELDFVWGLSSEAVKTFVPQVITDFEQKPPKFLLDHSSEFVTQMYNFNTTRPPFDNVKVRQAFCYAIDRNHIVEEVLAREAYGPGINGICPPALPGYKASDVKGYETVADTEEKTKAQKEADREMARKLLAEAGYKTIGHPNGKEFPSVKLVLNSGGMRNTLVADEVRTQLQEVLGVNLEIANVSFQQKLSDERFARADMFRSAWVADYPTAESFLSLYYGADVPDSLSSPSYPNTTRYRNAAFDQHYQAGRTAKTQAEANKHFLAAEQLMMADAPSIILWYDENYRLTQYRVKNFFTNPMRYLDFSQVYIKEEPMKEGGKSDSAGGGKKSADAEKKDDNH